MWPEEEASGFMQPGIFMMKYSGIPNAFDHE